MYIYIYACCVSKTSKVLVTHIMSIQPKNQKLYLGVERKWKILVIGQRYFNNQPQCTIEMSPQTIFSKASQKGAVQIATIFKRATEVRICHLHISERICQKHHFLQFLIRYRNSSSQSI